jgi:hypothetical protein
MKKIILLLLLITYSFSFAQENYKYIIVPKKFEFFKNENEYNTNFMAKSFFEKEGFKVLYDTDNFPQELANNRCLALSARAVKNSNILVTKITIELIDCYNKVVYISDQGTSREKEFQKAYTEAFRIALSSMSGKLNFKPSGISNEIVIATPIEMKSTPEVAPAVVEEATTVTTNSNQLFAIPTGNGYKIVNSEPKIIMMLYKTSIKEVFIAEKDYFTGVLLKKNNSWYLEWYSESQFFSEKVEVKF